MYEDVTIRVFKNAWFKQDFSEISKDDFEVCYNEYVDTAGLYATEQFEKIVHIHYLNNRINSISIGIKLQKDFLNNFGVPNIEGLKFFSKFGHNISWSKDEKISNEQKVEWFLTALNRMELKEKKYISMLEIEYKSLIDLNLKKVKKEQTPKQSRESFIRMVNSLGKIGSKIDNDNTTVEDLAYMIKQQSEENQINKNSK